MRSKAGICSTEHALIASFKRIRLVVPLRVLKDLFAHKITSINSPLNLEFLEETVTFHKAGEYINVVSVFYNML